MTYKFVLNFSVAACEECGGRGIIEQDSNDGNGRKTIDGPTDWFQASSQALDE